MADERFDGLLLNIASHTEGIDELLDVFLGFLRRKTDTFNPPGGFSQLEKSFVGALRRQFDLAQGAKKAKDKAAASKASKSSAAPAKASTVPEPPPAPEHVVEMSADGSFDLSTTSTTKPVKPSEKPVASASAASPPSRSPDATSSRPDVAVEAVRPAASPAAGTTTRGGAPAAAAATPGAAVDSQASAPPPEEGAPSGNGGAAPLPGNGGVTDAYSWSQTLGEVTVHFPVPWGTKPRDVAVDIRAGHVQVGLKGRAPLLDAPLPHKVKADDSYWTLDDDAYVAPAGSGSSVGASADSDAGSKTLTLYLTKFDTMTWWDRVAQGQPHIDITKITPENSKLGDLDGETRKTVGKMMFDQAQKARGLPTSDELSKQDALKRFMAAHPEMDFSKAKFM